jgi:hypothetical protein
VARSPASALAQAGVQYFVVGVWEDAETPGLLAEQVVPEVADT